MITKKQFDVWESIYLTFSGRTDIIEEVREEIGVFPVDYETCADIFSHHYNGGWKGSDTECVAVNDLLYTTTDCTIRIKLDCIEIEFLDENFPISDYDEFCAVMGTVGIYRRHCRCPQWDCNAYEDFLYNEGARETFEALFLSYALEYELEYPYSTLLHVQEGGQYEPDGVYDVSEKEAKQKLFSCKADLDSIIVGLISDNIYELETNSGNKLVYVCYANMAMFVSGDYEFLRLSGLGEVNHLINKGLSVQNTDMDAESFLKLYREQKKEN